MLMQILSATLAAATGVVVLAAGEDPAWRVERAGDTLVLHRPGQKPVVARGIATRRTPVRTVVSAPSATGRQLAIGIVFGACQLPGSARQSSYMAMVAFGELRLRGCFLVSPPGERPLLD